jgi:hypothetical protein
MTHSIKTFSIMTLNIKNLFSTLSIISSVIVLNVAF